MTTLPGFIRVTTWYGCPRLINIGSIRSIYPPLPYDDERCRHYSRKFVIIETDRREICVVESFDNILKQFSELQILSNDAAIPQESIAPAESETRCTNQPWLNIQETEYTPALEASAAFEPHCTYRCNLLDPDERRRQLDEKFAQKAAASDAGIPHPIDSGKPIVYELDWLLRGIQAFVSRQEYCKNLPAEYVHQRLRQILTWPPEKDVPQ